MTAHDPDDKDYAPIGGQMVRAADGSVCPSIAGHNVRMDYLAFSLSRGLDRAVLDNTGLPGRYDVNLLFIPDGAAGPAISPDCTDLFSAFA